MYPYNYNMNNFNRNMYRGNPNNDRFIAGGFIGPLLLGGVAGYALGNNRPNYYYPPRPYYYPTYYNNNYFYNPYYYY